MSSQLNPPTDSPAAGPAPTGLFRNPWVRAGASLFIAYHLAAVLLDPLATPPNFAGPRPVVTEAVRPGFQGYVTALSLDHTYKFFAPNPGDSHLFRYDLYFADGTKSVGAPEQTFPDRRRHWPRLLYHRYFMLAEHLPAMREWYDWSEPDRPAPGRAQGQGGATHAADSEQRADRERRADRRVRSSARRRRSPRSRRDAERRGSESSETSRGRRLGGIAAHLAKKHHAQRVDLYHIIHRLSVPPEILEGRKLSEPDTYRERLIFSYKTTEFDNLPPQLGTRFGTVKRPLPPGDASAQHASEVRR